MLAAPVNTVNHHQQQQQQVVSRYSELGVGTALRALEMVWVLSYSAADRRIPVLVFA